MVVPDASFAEVWWLCAQVFTLFKEFPQNYRASVLQKLMDPVCILKSPFGQNPTTKSGALYFLRITRRPSKPRVRVRGGDRRGRGPAQSRTSKFDLKIVSQIRSKKRTTKSGARGFESREGREPQGPGTKSLQLVGLAAPSHLSKQDSGWSLYL